jgi:predicted CoA-binding protein
MSDTRSDDWRHHLLEHPDQIRALLERVRRVAVLGIKPESRADRPAFFVPEYVQAAGFEVIPVPCYYPEVTHILGQPVYRRLADIPGRIDLVNVFRRPADIPAHMNDMLSVKPGAVWMQAGIRHDEVAETLARAGIDVVQDRCLMIELEVIGR